MTNLVASGHHPYLMTMRNYYLCPGVEPQESCSASAQCSKTAGSCRPLPKAQISLGGSDSAEKNAPVPIHIPVPPHFLLGDMEGENETSPVSPPHSHTMMEMFPE